MSFRRVAVIHLGRPTALGEARRVAAWRSLLEHLGAEVIEVALLGVAARRRPVGLATDASKAVTGHLVPEALSWSADQVLRQLDHHGVGTAVCVSARAFHPSLVGEIAVVLDFVDQLSLSYRQRAQLAATPVRRCLLNLLADRHARFERRATPGVTRVAAGWTDARELRATWVPNVIEPPALPRHEPDTDLLFVGTLNYPPNVAAVERLSRIWPRITAIRPATTMLVAGARPDPAVRSIARKHGWTLVEDFDSLGALAARCLVSVAPLDFTAGLQNKVLDAAAYGLPVVASEDALRGFPPGFPAIAARDDEDFICAVLTLLGDEERRTALATLASEVARRDFVPSAWATTIRGLLSW